MYDDDDKSKHFVFTQSKEAFWPEEVTGLLFLFFFSLRFTYIRSAVHYSRLNDLATSIVLFEFYAYVTYIFDNNIFRDKKIDY